MEPLLITIIDRRRPCKAHGSGSTIRTRVADADTFLIKALGDDGEMHFVYKEIEVPPLGFQRECAMCWKATSGAA